MPRLMTADGQRDFGKPSLPSPIRMAPHGEETLSTQGHTWNARSMTLTVPARASERFMCIQIPCYGTVHLRSHIRTASIKIHLPTQAAFYNT